MVDATYQANVPPAIQQALYAALSDHELLSLGVPEDWLDRIRMVQSETELDVLQASLPVEAYEGLFLVSAGDTVVQVLSARETHVDRAINISDFAGALGTPESQSRFVVVEDDEGIAQGLRGEFDRWLTEVGAQRNEPNPNFDRELHRKLYRDTDVSELKPKATAAATAEPLREWRTMIDGVVRKK